MGLHVGQTRTGLLIITTKGSWEGVHELLYHMLSFGLDRTYEGALHRWRSIHFADVFDQHGHGSK